MNSNQIAYEKIGILGENIRHLFSEVTNTTVVYLAGSVLDHIFVKHSNQFDVNKGLKLLPSMINKPKFIYSGKKKNSFQFVEDYSENYYLMTPIKCLPTELWVETMTIEEKERFIRRWSKYKKQYERKN